MSPIHYNKHGFTLIEMLIALAIFFVGVAAFMTVIPTNWGLASRSDWTGRAAEIMNEEFQRINSLIMNPCNVVVTGASGPQNVNASGQLAAAQGDAAFVINRTIAPAPNTTIGWLVTITISPVGSSSTISETQLCVRQEFARYPNTPTRCDDDTRAVNFWGTTF